MQTNHKFKKKSFKKQDASKHKIKHNWGGNLRNSILHINQTNHIYVLRKTQRNQIHRLVHLKIIQYMVIT